MEGQFLCSAAHVPKKVTMTFVNMTRARAIRGTFVTPEFYAAIEAGYEVLEIYEVLHYEQHRNDIFRPFIKMWLKIKQEASGPPSWVKTPQDLKEYIKQSSEQQGIELEENNIKLDLTLRLIAKLLLNSLYGKFGQRPNLPVTILVDEYQKLRKLLTDETIHITGLRTVSDDKILVCYKKINDEDCDPGNTSVAIAAFVTSYAREELRHWLEEATKVSPEPAYYCDTDSVMYMHKIGTPDLPLGSLLVELTDEIGTGSSKKGAFGSTLWKVRGRGLDLIGREASPSLAGESKRTNRN